MESSFWNRCSSLKKLFFGPMRFFYLSKLPVLPQPEKIKEVGICDLDSNIDSLVNLINLEKIRVNGYAIEKFKILSGCLKLRKLELSVKYNEDLESLFQKMPPHKTLQVIYFNNLIKLEDLGLFKIEKNTQKEIIDTLKIKYPKLSQIKLTNGKLRF